MNAIGSDARVSRTHQRLARELHDKEARDAFVAEHTRSGIAHQIATLREQRGWSQAELGRKAGKPQSVIARLENPDAGAPNLTTLLEIASAFDVALQVRFVAHSQLLEWTRDVSTKALEVPSFTDAQSALALPKGAPASSPHGAFEVISETRNERVPHFEEAFPQPPWARSFGVTVDDQTSAEGDLRPRSRATMIDSQRVHP